LIGDIKEKCSKKVKRTNTPFYLEDSKILNSSENDINETKLKAKLLANNIEKHLEPNSVNAFSIGVIGKWGYGKSSFISALLNDFDKNKYILIEFNPRNSLNAQHIVQDFFKEFKNKINEKCNDSTQSLDNYLRSIDVLDENQIRQFITGIYTALFPNATDEKQQLNDSIVARNLKIIVTIDDLDRLLLDEVLEVFKIIDGLANFKNTVFITAYDKELVNGIIGEKYSSNETLYTDKYFNLEIYLAAQPFEEIYKYLLFNLSVKLELNDTEKKVLESDLESLKDILFLFIKSIRDAKRFINLFIHHFFTLKERLVYKEAILLHLLKSTRYTEYLFVQRNMFTKTDFFINVDDMFNNDVSRHLLKLKILFAEHMDRNSNYRNDKISLDELNIKLERKLEHDLIILIDKIFVENQNSKSISNQINFHFYFMEFLNKDIYKETVFNYSSLFDSRNLEEIKKCIVKAVNNLDKLTKGNVEIGLLHTINGYNFINFLNDKNDLKNGDDFVFYFELLILSIKEAKKISFDLRFEDLIFEFLLEENLSKRFINTPHNNSELVITELKRYYKDITKRYDYAYLMLTKKSLKTFISLEDAKALFENNFERYFSENENKLSMELVDYLYSVYDNDLESPKFKKYQIVVRELIENDLSLLENFYFRIENTKEGFLYNLNYALFKVVFNDEVSLIDILLNDSKISDVNKIILFIMTQNNTEILQVEREFYARISTYSYENYRLKINIDIENIRLNSEIIDLKCESITLINLTINTVSQKYVFNNLEIQDQKYYKNVLIVNMNDFEFVQY